MQQKKLIVVAGPTAVGKTFVAIRLAAAFQTVVVSADSRQMYREMTIGTAKPSPAELATVPHYFVDSHSVEQEYNAASYTADALNLISGLFERYHEVILCGGSGLYIKGVCEGFDEMPDVPDDLRTELSMKYRDRGLSWLQDELRQTDPEVLQVIDPRNPHRLIRALGVKLASGRSILSFQKNIKQKRDFDIIKIGLELPREVLHARIDRRMDQMIADGLVDEARRLYPLRHHNALQTVGYQEIFGFIENQYDLGECIRLLKRNSRRYAKRQLTWFKKDPEFSWFSPDDVNEIINHIRHR